MNDREKQILNYIISLLFDTKITEEMPFEFSDSKELEIIDETLRRIREAVYSLGFGDLSNSIDGKGYTMGIIKNLQASLKNLTWQTKMIAEGDFSQQVNFLGEFSDAFNSMAKKLQASLQELNKSKELFQMVFETIPDATIITSLKEGVIFDVNTAYCNLSGYSKDELLNRSVFDIGFIKELKEKDELERTLEKNNYYKNKVIDLITKDKVNIKGLFSSQIIFIDNKKYVLSVIKDITQRIEMEEKIKKLSITDKLTQLNNRLKLDEALKNEINRIERSHSISSLVILDIDNFKAVNDNYGHQIGDTVLVEIANILKTNIRDVDVVGRWGGEEFMLILPFTNTKGATICSNKLREKIANHSFSGVGQVTASFGISEVKPGLTAEQIVAKADVALYKAKDLGRNKVVS